MYLMRDYDRALEEILRCGDKKTTATRGDVLALFGIESRYDLTTHFPIVTRRRVWPRSIFAELVWFLSGSTNNRDLQTLGANHWTPWVDADFESKHGYAPGALGPLYGFQLRHFGGEYGRGEGGVNYGYGGFDQLAHLVHEIKVHPNSRHNLFSLWNPQQTHMMRVPPCTHVFQVYVYNGKLSGHLTQRSCDFPVGVPADIQLYAGLVCLLAQQCDLEPHELVHETVDSHIYVNQIPAVEEYLMRPVGESPTLTIKKAKDIYSYMPDDFVLDNYSPQAVIKVPVTV